MSSINPTNEKGQGASHAYDSQVPGKAQEKVWFRSKVLFFKAQK